MGAECQCFRKIFLVTCWHIFISYSPFMSSPRWISIEIWKPCRGDNYRIRLPRPVTDSLRKSSFPNLWGCHKLELMFMTGVSTSFTPFSHPYPFISQNAIIKSDAPEGFDMSVCSWFTHTILPCWQVAFTTIESLWPCLRRSISIKNTFKTYRKKRIT